MGGDRTALRPDRDVIVFYDAGGWAVKVFDLILKAMVGVVVIIFFAVVVRMSLAGDLDWGQILTGFIPNFSMTGTVSCLRRSAHTNG
ncbi:MAG: hypothetical protein R3B91_19670 [Planctomycetaceae bacterium]